MKCLSLGAAFAAVLGGAALRDRAQAQDSIYVPLLTYRTGPFAGSGIPIANGMHDYLTMLNERDGGIGGVKIVFEECETGYDTKKGVECYEQVKGKKPVVVNPYSTGITLALIPKAASTRSRSCRWPTASRPRPTATLSPGSSIRRRPTGMALSMIIRYIGEKEGGIDKLKGKTIGYHLSRWRLRPGADPAAREVRQEIRLHAQEISGARQRNAEPVGAVAQRPPRPAGLDDHVGLGRHEPDRGEGGGQDQLSDGQVRRHLVVGRRRRRAAGRRGRQGISSLNFHAVGTDFPAMQDIKKHVSTRARARSPEGQVRREILQPRRLQLRARRRGDPQCATDHRQESGHRRGRAPRPRDASRSPQMRWKELGLPNFGAPVEVTCADHNGHHTAYMQQWDGAKWVKVSDWIDPMKDASARCWWPPPRYTLKRTSRGRSAPNPATSRIKSNSVWPKSSATRSCRARDREWPISLIARLVSEVQLPPLSQS